MKSGEERYIKAITTILTRVLFPATERDFPPTVNFQSSLSYGVAFMCNPRFSRFQGFIELFAPGGGGGGG